MRFSATGGICNIGKAVIGDKENYAIIREGFSAMINKTVSIFLEKESYLFVIEYSYSQGQLEMEKQLTPEQENQDWALAAKDERMLYELKQKIISSFKFIK